jgi:hypothetical protein
MRLYYNASLKAHASVSSKADGELLKSAGYKLRSNDGLQGYILSDDPGRPGWIALNLYWNKKTKRALTATAAVAKNLKLKDYKRISAQGWVFSGLTAITVRKNIRRFIRKMK